MQSLVLLTAMSTASCLFGGGKACNTAPSCRTERVVCKVEVRSCPAPAPICAPACAPRKSCGLKLNWNLCGKKNRCAPAPVACAPVHCAPAPQWHPAPSPQHARPSGQHHAMTQAPVVIYTSYVASNCPDGSCAR